MLDQPLVPTTVLNCIFEVNHVDFTFFFSLKYCWLTIYCKLYTCPEISGSQCLYEHTFMNIAVTIKYVNKSAHFFPYFFTKICHGRSRSDHNSQHTRRGRFMH